MSKEPASKSEIVLYQMEDGRTRLEVRFEGETAWLTQAQMAELFQTTKQNVSLHIQNIFAEGELHEDSVVKESLTTAAVGKNYATKLYNPDVIINQPSPAEKDFEKAVKQIESEAAKPKKGHG
jgi:hypothetical protein